ncbi:MAG: hypothetical protein AB7S86_10075 [Hydrogenophaga sp.]|uniref:hypothetical protein n=1 Tax=Hydrogenophaga sp. TaxID=1904254 RepID=UPI003D152030
MITSTRHHLRTCIAAAALAISLPAWAASSADKASIEANYKAARSACQSIAAPADRTNCLRDAGAARAQALRTGKTSITTPAQRERNALLRCQVHKTPEDRAICERMARGEGSVSGSVQSGGTIRELTTQIPAPSQPR